MGERIDRKDGIDRSIGSFIPIPKSGSLMRIAGRIAIGLLVLALLPGVAAAHSVATDTVDSPVPFDLVLFGAALTVAITAGWLFWHGEAPGLDRRWWLGSVSPSTARGIRTVARLAFFALFVGVLFAGLFGRQVRAENPATLFVWPVWLKGVALFAIAAGSPWRILAPWRTIYEALVRLEGREIVVLGRYPERLGAWPALLGYVLLIGVVENLTVIPDSPRRTAILVAGGSLLLVFGGLCFGRTWFRNADPFDVLYRLFGRVAPLAVTRRDDGGYDLALRPPWQGCTTSDAGPAVATFVLATVYTVSFDGFSNTRRYQELLFDLRDFLGTGPGTSTLLYVGGLLGFLLAYLGATSLIAYLGASGVRDAGDATGDRGTGVIGGDAGRDGTDGGWIPASIAFAPTIVPIAAAYEVAHNYPYVARNLDRLVVELLDPVVALEPIEPIARLALGTFWSSQIALIVLGHAVAVVAAHAVALELFDSERAARRGHLPLVVVMIGYTVVSLWIVSQPVVGG